LQENFKKRIESLATDNTRTHDIKVKMDKYEEERKESRFLSFCTKQMEHMKRMKKKEKERAKQREKTLHKSLERQELVTYNKKVNADKWNDFKHLADEKFRRTVKPYDISQQIHDENESKQRKIMKKRLIQQKEMEKLKQEIIDKHIHKMKQKEALEKKKEEIVHFSLLKQKELL